MRISLILSIEYSRDVHTHTHTHTHWSIVYASRSPLVPARGNGNEYGFFFAAYNAERDGLQGVLCLRMNRHTDTMSRIRFIHIHLAMLDAALFFTIE